MRHLLQHIVYAAFLAFALILAGVFSAVAEGKMLTENRGVTSMVICSDQGPVSVSFDSSGNPVVPSGPDTCEFCPACIFNAVAVPDLSAPWVRPAQPAHPLTTPVAAVQRRGETALWRYARGPPNEA